MKRKPKYHQRIVKGKPVSLSPSPWDMGATGPANRHGLEIEEAADINPETGEVQNPNGVLRARRVDMLEVWARKGVISTAGHNVAEKLRDAFLATQKSPGWPDNDRVQSSPKPDHAVTIQIDRLSAFANIMRHIEPRDRLIIDICVLQDRSPAHLRDKFGRRPYYGPGHKDGLIHIREALDRLARAMGG